MVKSVDKASKEISKDFAIASKQQETKKLMILLDNNPDFVLPQNSFIEANSVNFGKNCFLEPKLIDYSPNIGIDKMSCFKGMVYQKKNSSELLAFQPQINSNSFSEETVKTAAQEHKIMSDVDFQVFMEKFFTLNQFTQTQQLEARNFYISRLKFNPTNFSFLVEQLEAQKSMPAELEKTIQKIIRQTPNLLVSAIEKSNLDVNIQYPLYSNNIAHHYCFYKSELPQDFLNILKARNFNPNLINNFGETPLALLLNNNKIDMATDFLMAFKDTLDVNLKTKGKTYLHKIILMIESSSHNLHYTDARFQTQHKQLIDFFEKLIHFSPAIDIRSGEKSRGTTAISYLEKKITNKDLSEALKSKILIELAFGVNKNSTEEIAVVEAPKKKFKL